MPMPSITRRSFLSAVSTASAAVVAGRAFGADPVETPPTPPNFGTAPVDRTPLGGGLVMLSGPGGNITVLPASAEEGGTLVVDSGIAPRAADVLAAVTALGGGAAPRTLVNTHWHADHTGGNVRLGTAGATIVAHDNTLARLSSTQRIAFMAMDVPPTDPIGRPVVTFADTATAHRGGHAIRLAHMPPAHTDSDITVHFQDADVLVAGDLMFNGLYPFIDYSSGGSLDGMIASSERLLLMTTTRTKIVPGHGPLADRGDVAGFRDMLIAVRDRLTKFAADRVPLADVQAKRPLADLDAKWGQRMFHGANFIHLVYPAMLKA